MENVAADVLMLMPLTVRVQTGAHKKRTRTSQKGADRSLTFSKSAAFNLCDSSLFGYFPSLVFMKLNI